MGSNEYDLNSVFQQDSPADDDSYLTLGEARRQLRGEVLKTLAEINTLSSQAQAGIQTAIEEVSTRHPDFKEQRSRMLATLQEIPLLKDAVSTAESNPQLSSTLPQLYEVVWRASQAPTATSASEPAKRETQDDLSDEGTQYRAALASQRVSLTPENRKAILADLEKRGVLDVEF